MLPATSSVSPTGNTYVDGVLTGVKWATTSLTYSFPSTGSLYGTSYGSGEHNNNFEAFTATQQTAVRLVLANYSAVSNLSFTEVTETSTQHGDLRYAESDAPSTAWGYYPSTNAAGGDMWFNNSTNRYDNPVVGNYAYLTILHETGHALGLKHPHEVTGSFGALPVDRDSLEYSVMSYRSYIGASTAMGYINGTYSFPQTLMMLDIAAIQEMYGADYTTNSGATVYKWNPTTGEMSINGVGQGAPGGNKIFMTLWDGGGNDTYDFSNYTTNLKVDLNPGGWTTVSTAQLANLSGTKLAVGNIANALLFHDNPASLIENAIGGSGNDIITGNIANNRLTGGAGNDYIDGAAGTDTAVFSGLFASYSLVQSADGTWSITDLRTGSIDGVDTLVGVEWLQFGDSLVAMGTTAPPINHAPTITSSAPTVTLTEWADQSAAEAANTPHTASGIMTFTDADSTDTHTASFAARGNGYLGTFSLATNNIDTSGSLGWSFSVSDSAIDFLAAGQLLTQLYDVTIDDGHGGAAMRTVTVTIGGTDDAPLGTANTSPLAVDDIASVLEDAAVDINVLLNDSDPDGSALALDGLPTALHGTVSLNTDGTLHYRPNANYYGSDTITYAVTDGALADTGQVAVTVMAGNDVPVAQNDVYSTGKNMRLTVSGSGVLANDTDLDGTALSALLVSKPAHGTLTLNANGSFNYKPTKNFVGTDSFTYKDSDGSGVSNTATVTIKVGMGTAGQGGRHDDWSFDSDIANDQAPAPAPWTVAYDQRLADVMTLLGMPQHDAAYLL